MYGIQDIQRAVRVANSLPGKAAAAPIPSSFNISSFITTRFGRRRRRAPRNLSKFRDRPSRNRTRAPMLSFLRRFTHGHLRGALIGSALSLASKLATAGLGFG